MGTTPSVRAGAARGMWRRGHVETGGAGPRWHTRLADRRGRRMGDNPNTLDVTGAGAGGTRSRPALPALPLQITIPRDMRHQRRWGHTGSRARAESPPKQPMCETDANTPRQSLLATRVLGPYLHRFVACHCGRLHGREEAEGDGRAGQKTLRAPKLDRWRTSHRAPQNVSGPENVWTRPHTPAHTMPKTKSDKKDKAAAPSASSPSLAPAGEERA